MLKTEAIKNFLVKRTHADLASLYNHDMECQVNVAADGGERIEGEEFRGKKRFSYSDGLGNVWKSFRIPYNAATVPEYEDRELTYNLADHVESIGLTGWDWKQQISRWVAFDFDAIVGHSTTHTSKLSAEELSRIEKLASELDYVTIRKSTSGSGLHMYVFLETPAQTRNHNEHSALGRAILTQMSAEVGYDFVNSVDIAGGNMWIWHRKMEVPNCGGLDLIKQGVPLTRLPDKWKELHLDVVEKRKIKATEPGEDGESLEITESRNHLADQRPRIQLDNDHKKLIDRLKQLNGFTHYNHDQNMLVTHTTALKEAHTELGLVGLFETTTNNTSDVNCFCFPCSRGGWVVYRFSRGCAEHASWELDVGGWRRCYYNMLPTIRGATNFFGGIENPKGGFDFQTAEAAVEAAKKLGIEVTIPDQIKQRQATIIEKQDGRVLIEIDNKGIVGTVHLPGWGSAKDKWYRIFEKPISKANEFNFTNEFDEMIRYVINTSRSEIGWFYYPPNNEFKNWNTLKKDNLKDALCQRGYGNDEQKDLFGACVNNPWVRVNMPFKGEYPGNRQWNHDSAKFAVPLKPSNEDLRYPTWMRILHHVGKNLTRSVREDRWCKENGIMTGGDFLKIWCANMFQFPEARLPYLFFYSPAQHTGKSTFHESLAMLMSKGYVKADRALTEAFNGELETAVLCAIEEINLSADKNAYNKVKDYTTSEVISVRPMYSPQTHSINTTHWIHCANHLHYVPIEPNDTRIIITLVDEIPEKDLMSKETLYNLLRKEASDFLTELLTLELPIAPPGRMRVPVLITEEKRRAEKNKESHLETFLRENVYYVPGATTSVVEFTERFLASLDPADRVLWHKKRISREMPMEKFPKGRSTKHDNTFMYGNMSFDQNTRAADKKLILRGEKLVVDDLIQ